MRVFFLWLFILLSLQALSLPAYADEDYAGQLKEEDSAKAGIDEDKSIETGDKTDEDLGQEKGDEPPKGKAPVEDAEEDRGSKQSLVEPVDEDKGADSGAPPEEGSRPQEDTELDNGD